MSKKLTPWFPVAVKPARRGVYSVEKTDLAEWFSYWDGTRFNWHSKNCKGAFAMRKHEGCGWRTSQWRGLAKKP